MDDERTSDTIIADLDGWRLPKSTGRGREDLTMQVFLDSGEWHRKAVGGNFTACGEAIDYRLRQNHRPETYEGRLCRNGCFSSFELALSDTENQRTKNEEE